VLDPCFNVNGCGNLGLTPWLFVVTFACIARGCGFASFESLQSGRRALVPIVVAGRGFYMFGLRDGGGLWDTW